MRFEILIILVSIMYTYSFDIHLSVGAGSLPSTRGKMERKIWQHPGKLTAGT